MILFIFICYLLFIKEYIYSFGKLEFNNLQRFSIELMNYCKWIMGWEQIVHTKCLDNELVQLRETNKILLISNHQNMIDFVHLQYFISVNFPMHKMLFVINSGYKSVPFFGKYMDNLAIPIEGNYAVDKQIIEKKINCHKDEKVILVLFPEGKIIHKENVKKSIEWCKNNNIKSYTHTLAPRTKGIYTVLRSFNPDTVLQSYISYCDDIHHSKGVEYIDFINGNLPRICNITIKKANLLINMSYHSFSTFEKKFYTYWRKIDRFIRKQYKRYENKHIQFEKDKHMFHDYVIPMNEITWVSSKYNLLFLPFAFMTHGFWYGMLAVLLLVTSYQYHVFKKWKYIDIIVACSTLTISFYLSKHNHSKIFLLYGVFLYILYKFFMKYLHVKEKDTTYFFHSGLHALGTTHIFVEFLLDTI